jgi:hypothetical protein
MQNAVFLILRSLRRQFFMMIGLLLIVAMLPHDAVHAAQKAKAKPKTPGIPFNWNADPPPPKDKKGNPRQDKKGNVLPGVSAKGRSSARLDDHQFAYTDWYILSDGTGRVHTKFTNGKQADGDTMATFTQSLDGDGKLLALVRLAAGVNPRGLGHDTEVNVSAPIKRTPDEWAQVKY